MGPIFDPYTPNIGLSGLPLTAPRESPLRSHAGSQMARPDRPHLGAHIVLTWVPPVNVTWDISSSLRRGGRSVDDDVSYFSFGK